MVVVCEGLTDETLRDTLHDETPPELKERISRFESLESCQKANPSKIGQDSGPYEDWEWRLINRSYSIQIKNRNNLRWDLENGKVYMLNVISYFFSKCIPEERREKGILYFKPTSRPLSGK